ILQAWQVYPATASRTTRGRAKLAPSLSNLLPYFIQKLCWERPATHAGAVCLEDTIHFTDVLWCNTKAGAGTCHDSARGSYEGISSEVNIQQRSLCSL